MGARWLSMPFQPTITIFAEKLFDASTDGTLPGAVGWPESGDVDDIARQIMRFAGQSLAQDSATLRNTYGTRDRHCAWSLKREN